MGYDTDRFISPVNDALSCCICRDVLEDPLQAPCEHAYCKSCIEGWLVHETSCPEDRRILTHASLRPLFRYMRNDLNRLQIRCRNHAHGCHHITDLEFLEQHENTCVYERLKCPNDRCTFYAVRQDVDEHARTCVFGQKECPKGCGFTIMRNSDFEHNCFHELRTAVEVMRTEITCKYEDQKNELELRLDMQRNHMIQKEALLQSQIDFLTLENSRLTQNVKFLMDAELSRRQEVEKLELEKQELMELLRKNARSQVSEVATGGQQTQRNVILKGKVTTL